jgi:tRNA 2-thiouridine synthesizing protein A
MPILDVRGLLCPLPVVRARGVLTTIAPGAVLEVLADDPLARTDLRVFCAREGHEYLGDRVEPGGGWRVTIRNGGPAGNV